MKVYGWVLMSLALATCGCSTFNYEYQRELKKPVPTSDITGPWEGTWVSTTSKHNDRLRCLITRDETGTYHARFRAWYKRILQFGYTVPLDARQGADRVDFRGIADLGKLAGGVYTYEGYATPTNFFSTYDSKYDRGTFQMSRPKN